MLTNHMEASPEKTLLDNTWVFRLAVVQDSHGQNAMGEYSARERIISRNVEWLPRFQMKLSKNFTEERGQDRQTPSACT